MILVSETAGVQQQSILIAAPTSTQTARYSIDAAGQNRDLPESGERSATRTGSQSRSDGVGAIVGMSPAMVRHCAKEVRRHHLAINAMKRLEIGWSEIRKSVFGSAKKT
jgi:hypothetical protein